MLFIVKRPTTGDNSLKICKQRFGGGQGLGGEPRLATCQQYLFHHIARHMGQQRLADARSMHLAARPGAKHRPDRILGFDLRDENDISLISNAQIGGFTGLFHQPPHRALGGLHQVGAP